MRPRYHYAPASNWLSDPNGLVHHDGEWHMFYQYNPEGEDWGHMSWGHAVSRDLAHWEELPIAIRDDALHMIFSGSAVIDHEGVAGFGKGVMVALYTGAMAGEPARQAQCLAWSNDGGRTWSKFSGNPVLDLGLADFRDPNVFWHEGSGRWIMVVALSTEHSALIYASDNLRDWSLLSAIAGDDAPGVVWECPMLVELPVEGGGDRWLFKVDVMRDGPGSGTIYRTGSFDGQRFVPDAEGWKVADWGADFYAAIAWPDPRDELGRPLWIGWMGNHDYQGQLPSKGWRGAMSVPRRLWLRRTGAGTVLCQAMEPSAVAGVARFADNADPIAGHLLMTSQSWAIDLRDVAGHSLAIRREAGRLRVERRDRNCPALDAVREVALGSGKAVDLWLDAGSLEVIADAGAVSLTMQHALSGITLTVD